MGRTDGHVIGLESLMNAWLIDRFLKLNFDTAGNLWPPEALCVVANAKVQLGLTYDQQIDIDLEERRGNVALWRIAGLQAVGINPNNADGITLCGGWDLTPFFLDAGSPLAQPGWGCGVDCGTLTIRGVSAIPTNLMLMTLAWSYERNTARAFGYDMAVVIREAEDGATLADKWASVLGSLDPDSGDWGLESVLATFTGSTHPVCQTDPFFIGRAI